MKLYKATKGWGGIESGDAPGDVWFHFSAIDMPGYKELHAGDEVEFTYVRSDQNSWQYVATWVRKLP